MMMSRTSVGRLACAATAAVLISGAAGAVHARDLSRPDLKFTVSIPDDCLLEETTGTIEAVCSPDRDAAKTVDLPKARAFFLEVDAEHVPPDAKPYSVPDFRADVPEAVCGSGEPADVKIENVSESAAGSARQFAATIVCPPIAFLGLEERRASVRYLMGPKLRYRLMYRTPTATVDRNAAAGKAFLDSFRSTAE